MILDRWSRQYNIIDFTPTSEAEEMFVRRWIYENYLTLHEFSANGDTYTFKAINTVIAKFENDLYEFHAEDLHLQEMEAYFNEH